jgi:hypothetical protein
VALGSDCADADEFVSAATRGGVEAAAERTGTIIVRAGGRSAGISSATSSRASSLDRWKNRGSFFVLAAEEIGEAGREIACVHERSFARDFSSS